MPEVILPCPACGSTDCECLVCTINADESQTIHFHMACNKCFTSGPIADDAESAKKLWDSLPRALRWTHEPPKVAGWYWYQLDGHAAEPRKIDSSFDGEEYLGVRDGWYVNRITKKPHVKWAGPIPAPIEP